MAQESDNGFINSGPGDTVLSRLTSSVLLSDLSLCVPPKIKKY